jgi:hypothetical protein
VRVYFFCRQPGPPEAAGYEHGLVALAEGFRALGHQVAGNRDLWPVDGGWLIPRTDESPRDFDLVLISNESYSGPGTLPVEYLRLTGGPRRVFVDEADGWRTEASTDPNWPADLVLRTHYNRRFRYPSKVRPWAFGLTNRMIEATADGVPARERNPVVLCNFRVGHPVRDRLTRALKRASGTRWTWDDRIDTTPPTDPAAHRLWALTGRRHNPTYYQRLAQAQGCLAFGGFFAPGLASAPTSAVGRLGYRLIQSVGGATSTLTQFDSWRFWESLASGAVTVHGPLDAWGAQLPVMPQDGRDYVSYQPREPIESLFRRWQSCLDADTGRAWAREHYSPEAQARRLLTFLQETR